MSTFRVVTPAQASPKLAKNGTHENRPIIAAVLYLAPANLSGYEVCHGRTKGCTAACLNSAGRGGIGATFDENGALLSPNAIQACRIRRTVRFFEQRDAFMADLVRDVETLIRDAKSVDGVPAFRPNGTSDIDWQGVPCVRNGRQFANLFDAFPEVMFWDYTKRRQQIAATFAGALPLNYRVTFSRAETMANQLAAMTALKGGMNVAIVFSTKKGETLPAEWNGHRVIDGDVTDFRFTDPMGVVVGLRAKGKARKDHSGFVVAV
jgi:hypothetical protein